MSLTVFYYLKVNNRFVKLQDIDEVLCNLSGVNISEKLYMIPTGNDISWKDLLADVLLELPSSKCRNHVVNLDDIIEAVCHYRTSYHIEDVASYIRCFYIMKVIGVQILAHYDNLGMFDDEGSNYYRHLYDNEVWMNKEDLLDYVKQLDVTEETKKSHKVILYNIYDSANNPSADEKRKFINRYDNQ